MNRSRRGIGGLMILTALVALAMTAARTPRRIGLVASIVAPTVVGIAVVGARFGLGRTRAFCAGFAAVGVACLLGSPAVAHATPRERVTRSVLTLVSGAAGGSATMTFAFWKGLTTFPGSRPDDGDDVPGTGHPGGSGDDAGVVEE